MAALIALSASPARAATISNWYTFSVNQDQLSGLTDFSALNHPLGPADRLFVRDAHFYRVGADGKPATADDQRVRLFGVNLTGAANFPDQQQAIALAARLRRLGFNAVRLHQLDAVQSDDEQHPKGILGSGAFPSFNPEAIRRLRFFIDQLKQQGIYVNLNLHVAYRFRYEVDQVSPLLDGQKMPFASHPLHLFEPRMLTLQSEYAQQLIRRLELNNDTALAMVEINNESSLLGAWQRGDLDQLSGEYERLLVVQWQRWLTHRYGSLQLACQQWQSCKLPRSGGLLVASGQADLLNYGEGRLAGVKSWLSRAFRYFGWTNPGWLQPELIRQPSGAAARVNDFAAFLIEQDRLYLDSLRKTLRAELGPQVPLSGTQIYYGGLGNFESQQAMDYIDEHFYVDHYDFPGQPWDAQDWRIRNQSVLGQAWRGLLERGYFRDARRPFVISEFNQAYPNQQSAEILPVMAALASAQDWDGLFFFQYGAADLQAAPDAFSLNGHSGQLVQTGSSAAMFRLFQFQPLANRLLLKLPASLRQQLAARRDGVASRAYMDYLQACCGLDARSVFQNQLALLLPPATEAEASASDRTTAAGASLSVSAGQPEPGMAGGNPGGEDQRYQLWQASNPSQGYWRYDPAGPHLSLQTRYFSLFAGSASEPESAGQPAGAPASWLQPQFNPAQRPFAVILLSSRDARPLQQSRRMLLTISGASSGTLANSLPARPVQLSSYPGVGNWFTAEPASGNNKPSGLRESLAPGWLEQHRLSLFFPIRAAQIRIYPLDAAGQRLAALPADRIQRQADGVRVEFNDRSPWYEILLN